MTDESLEKAIQEVWALFKETDKKIQEMSKRIEQSSLETDRKIQQSSLETNRKIQQVSEQIARSDKKAELALQSVNRLANKWGSFIENYLAPGIPKVFQEQGYPITQVARRCTSKRNGEIMEIDLLGVNQEYAVLVEVKSTLSVDDVKRHLKRLEKFKEFFPLYKDLKVMGAVAGIEITTDADQYASKQGLFVLGQKGEEIKILNGPEFRPKIW